MKYKVLNVIIIVVATVLISCAVCLLFTSCNKLTEKDEYKPYSEDGRFVEISCEWHRGSAWFIIQDTQTDKKYLCVGNNSPILMED